jgi:hypothetical protein
MNAVLLGTGLFNVVVPSAIVFNVVLRSAVLLEADTLIVIIMIVVLL